MIKIHKSHNVQIAILGTLCVGGIWYLTEGDALTVGIVGSFFTVILGKNATREYNQSRRGDYYDEDEGRVKKVE